MPLELRSCLWTGCVLVALNLACPGSGTTSASDTDAPATAGTTVASTGGVLVTAGSDATTTAAGSTGAQSEGLVVTVTPESPRSGSSAQLTATFDGQSAEVTWSLVGGPGSPGLTADGVLSLPMTAGTWTVRAALASDPQVTQDAEIVADFRGGHPVQAWSKGGRWVYDATLEDDLAADLVADASDVFAVIRHTTPPRAILVALVEATGEGLPGFGTKGVREFIAPGQTKMGPRQLALGGDRLYVMGDVVLQGSLAAASRATGEAIGAFGVFELPGYFGAPVVDPSGAGLFVGVDDLQGNIGAARVLASGALDMTWGTGGQTTLTVPPAWKSSWDPGKESLSVAATAVDAEGRLHVLAKSLDLENNGRVAVLFRCDGQGQLDASFGVGGAALWAIDDKAGTAPTKLQIAEDGALVVVGSHYGRWFASRFDANGDLDGGWGEGGHVTHAYQRNISMPAQATGVDVALMPGGYVVFLVDIDPSTAGLVRFTPEGTVDAEFGDVEADGDGWSLIKVRPDRLAAGVDGRVFVLGQRSQVYPELQVVERDAWIDAVHSY